VRLSFLALWVRDMFLRAANHNAPMQKRQKRQPHSKTLARGTQPASMLAKLLFEH